MEETLSMRPPCPGGLTVLKNWSACELGKSHCSLFSPKSTYLLRHIHRSPKQRLELIARHFVRRRLNLSAHCIPRVIHHHIQAPKMFLRTRKRILDLLGLRYVQRHKQELRFRVIRPQLGQPCRLGGVARGGNDTLACFEDAIGKVET